MLGFDDPVREMLCDARGTQLFRDDFGREKMPFQETSQYLTNAVFVTRHDRRMWNRNAERMAEESCYGEPVGQSADHSGFRGGTHIREPRPTGFEDVRDDEDDARHQQQTRRNAFHTTQQQLP